MQVRAVGHNAASSRADYGAARTIGYRNTHAPVTGSTIWRQAISVPLARIAGGGEGRDFLVWMGRLDHGAGPLHQAPRRSRHSHHPVPGGKADRASEPDPSGPPSQTHTHRNARFAPDVQSRHEESMEGRGSSTQVRTGIPRFSLLRSEKLWGLEYGKHTRTSHGRMGHG